MRLKSHARRLALLPPLLILLTLLAAPVQAYSPASHPISDAAGYNAGRSAGHAADRTFDGVTGRAADQLDRIITQLDRSARTPGTAWGIDPTANQVVVSVDPTVTGTNLAAVSAVVAAAGDAARIERLPTPLRLMASGGDAIFPGGSGRCALGFNASRGSYDYFVTAGHCAGSVGTTIYGPGGVVLGVTAATAFPNEDYAIVRYTNPYVSRPSAVNLYPGSRSITSAGSPYAGQLAQRSGPTTGLRSGTITGINVTVIFPDRMMTGLIRTNICAEPGDSGGPLFSGGVALGILVGGSGDCISGGSTFYEPIRDPLTRYGLTIP